MSRIFLIAGLGADTRIYKHIDLSGHEVVHVEWLAPSKNDTLGSYAEKLIVEYNITHGSIVIGNSLGGMLAVEIANRIALDKIIFISGIKTIDEAPRYFKFFLALPLYKLIPKKAIEWAGILIKPIFGRMSPEDSWLFNDMLKQCSPVFIKWAMGAALHWNNKIVPPYIHHISGDKDLVFPSKYLKNATIVKGGSHIMIFDKAEEINKLLKEILNK